MEFASRMEYEINTQTMALVAKFDEYGQVLTEVVEYNGRFDIRKCPSEVVDDSCKYFASSLDGRMSGTKQLTSYTHKPPIVISEAMGIYFFPVISPKRKECTWIAQKHIHSYKAEANNRTTIQFSNGSAITVPVSEGMIANQIQRTAHFRITLEDRLQISPPLSSLDFPLERTSESFS